MVFVGLLMVAFLCGVPIYLVALFFLYRKKPRPGIIFWLVNSGVAVIWAGFVLIVVNDEHKAPSAGQTASTTTTPSTQAPVNPGSATDNGSLTFKVEFPKPWQPESDGHAWLAASEADKQALAAAFSAASTQQHTAAFFYTNLNELYSSSDDKLSNPISLFFEALETVSPAKSYPTFQGFSWIRLDVAQTSQGRAQIVGVFWPDGHSCVHYQKDKSDIINDIGGNGPWDGDIATYPCTTILSGNTYTLRATAPGTWTDTGTFQVSVDGEELEMARPGHIPIRYKLLSQLVTNIDDAKPLPPP